MANATDNTPDNADTTPLTPHDAANDQDSPTDAANGNVAPNTPADLATEMKAAAKNAPADPEGNVTVDFGKAGKLTGGVVLNSVPGAALNFPAGQQVTVVFPLEDGRSTSISVDGALIK